MPRDDFKSVVGDDDSLFGSFFIQPSALLSGIAVVLGYIGLDVQYGRAVQDVQFANVQHIADNLVQPHRGQANWVGP